jgi:hypothetical protein
MSISGYGDRDFDLKNDDREKPLFPCRSGDSRASLRLNRHHIFTYMYKEKVVEVYFRN